MPAKRPASKTDPSAGTPRGSARFVFANIIPNANECDILQ
jgi:hypothetical protein